MTTTKIGQVSAETERLLAATKGMIAGSHSLARTVRDITIESWKQVVNGNDRTASAVDPWVEMVRSSHDRWLSLSESQAHLVVDGTLGLVRAGMTQAAKAAPTPPAAK